MKKMNYPFYFVFDVEAIGLHGEGFAVGAVVIDKKGSVEDELLLAVPPMLAKGRLEDFQWVKANIPELETPEATRGLPFVKSSSMRDLRDLFWTFWLKWKELDALMCADCTWPVEANFLEACVKDDLAERAWQGPYPLFDISTLAIFFGKDILEKSLRFENELPEHHPLMDARQSARQLIEMIKEPIRGKK